MEVLPYKLASPMLKLVTEELGRLLKEKALEVWQVDQNLRDLQVTYCQIEATLGQRDCWQINNSALEPCFHDLVMYCYDTEDLVDDLILSHSQDENPSHHPLRRKILKAGRIEFPRQIVKLQKKLKALGGQIQSLLSAGVINATQPRNSPSVACYPRLSLDKTPFVSGTSRDEDKQTIVMELTSLKPRSSGVSIVGMDGFGKTSLARSILADSRIKQEFSLVLSASVSADFQLDDIVHKLVAEHLETAESDRRDRIPTAAESHRRILQDLLGNQRVLIVMDDLWSVPDGEWRSFRLNFLDSSSSWKTLTTTRNPKVAEVTQTVTHYLDRMTDEDCKKLILEKVNLFGSEFEISANDVDAIAKKCNGMPVVADKFGLMLSRKTSVDELIEIIRHLKNTALWEMLEFKQVFPSLKLNEPKLPSHLERCFAYCSLFSANHKFTRDDLILLWRVEGLFRGLQISGSQCFDDLLSRSILQPVDSSNKSYEMHDFNFKFAQLLASKAFLQIDGGTANFLPPCRYIRHLSIAREDIDETLLNQIKECKGLRTCLLLHQRVPKRRTISSTFFLELKKLRLLDLSYTNISKLKDSSSSLKYLFKKNSSFKHLRYLDLSGTDIQELPEPINPLHALQVLKLENCSKLYRLPDDLSKLVSLTHLHVNLKRLDCLPPNLGRLTNLEVFISYGVGNKEGNKVTELKNMMLLREICVSRLENVNDKKEAEESGLSLKSMLRKLVLEWECPPAPVVDVRQVLEGLEPHDDLKDLIVRNYKCQQFPAWLSSPSKKLVSVYLQNCQDCQVLPSLGQLPLLKTLVLHSIYNVEVLDEQFHGRGERVFPRLELLEFNDMQKLFQWTGLKAGDMPCLHALKIIDCPELVSLPSLDGQGRLISLEINCCPKLISLPELSSSFNGESGKLIVADCPLVEERCQFGEADWEKIKDVCYKKIFHTTRTWTTPTTLPLVQNDKDCVKTAEDEPSSSQVQPTITKQMGEVHKNKNGYNVQMKHQLA